MDFLSLCLLTLWLYLPGFLANTFAMMWGKWLPKTGYGPWPIDGGRVMAVSYTHLTLPTIYSV